jgi:hypothetical protein
MTASILEHKCSAGLHIINYENCVNCLKGKKSVVPTLHIYSASCQAAESITSIFPSHEIRGRIKTFPDWFHNEVFNLCRRCQPRSNPLASWCKWYSVSATVGSTAGTDILELRVGRSVVVPETFRKGHSFSSTSFSETRRSHKGQNQRARGWGTAAMFLAAEDSCADKAVCAITLAWWMNHSWFRHHSRRLRRTCSLN